MRIHRGRHGKEEANVLAEGILLCTEEMGEEEPRIVTLLLKGFLVYLIVMGGIGCFLTSLDISCAWWIIHLGVLSGALFCALLYYSRGWQNIGYFLLLFGMFFSAVWLRRYISSGIFAVANELSRRASIFFGSNALKSYTEQIRDRSITIPVAMCYVGWVAGIVVNVLISRRMRYVAASVLSMVVLFIPLYLEREPSTLYILMLSGGLFLAFMFRKNGHYDLSLQNQRYQCDAKRKRITYVYAGKTMVHLSAVVAAVSLVLISLLGVFLPEEEYARVRSVSVMKAGTMDVMESFTLIGIMGLFNRYPNTGGLSGGTLGGVSAIQRDYETDLTVTYVPYSMDRMYLKSFTGDTYLHVQNKWDTLRDVWGEPLSEQEDATQRAYRDRYQSGDKMSAKGHMKITNVAAAEGVYLPYYSLNVAKKIALGNTGEYEYYLLHGDNNDYVSNRIGYSGDTTHSEHYAVPEENQEVIAQFCKEAGLQRDMDSVTVVKKLRDYFQANIPYTLRPGATPYQKDFVNYFLSENRRGYCAHFASAATLIFRYLGIPARYVEGYAIDPSDISEDGTVLAEERYEDYYDGYAPIGETAVVSVEVTDASAHAWVEIYDWFRGWHAVDVTPASTEAGSSGGLLQQFFDFLLSDSGDNDSQVPESGLDSAVLHNGSDRLASVGQYIGVILAFLAAVLLLFVLGRITVHRIIWYRRYHDSGYSDRLIMRYQNYIQRQERRNCELAGQLNYREQLQWLVTQGLWQLDEQEFQRAAAILERAGFSPEPITEEELEWMLGNFGKGRHLL